MRSTGALLVVVLLLVAAGCADARGTSNDSVVVRDSAGIRIVENPGGAGTAPAAGVEAVSIGAVDGEEAYTFNRVVDLVVSNAGVYVLDAGDNVIKLYDESGAHVRTFGGEGEGPAEFQRAFRLALVGDTLAVYDFGLQKLARFTAEGDLIRSDRVALPVLVFGLPALFEPVPGGFLGAMSSGCSLPRPPDLRALWRLLRITSDGTVRDTLAILRDREQVPLYGETFCSAVFAPARPPHALAVQADGMVAYGDGDPYEIVVFSTAVPDSGAAPSRRSTAAPPSPLDSRDVWTVPAPAMLIRVEAEPMPFTAADADAFWAEHSVPDTASSSDRERLEVLEAAIDTLGLPTHWPAFTHLRYDDGGRLWAARPTRPDAADRIWDVFDGEGVLTGSVMLPAGFTLHAIHGDLAWGIERDELDVMYVKAYRISR